MRLDQRLSRLEQGKPTPTRILVLRNNVDGEPELVGVVGGGMYYRENFPDEDAFWTAIRADEERAWQADPHNPDPIGGLFKYVAKNGRRIGDTTE